MATDVTITQSNLSPTWQASTFAWNGVKGTRTWAYYYISSAVNVSEDCALTDGTAKATGKSFNEGLSVADFSNKAIGKPLKESFHLSDKTTKAAVKKADEAFALTDIMNRNAIFARTMLENIGVAELVSKAVNRSFAEAFTLTEKKINDIGKNMSEVITLAEAFSRKVRFYLNQAETITMIEHVGKSYGLAKYEAFQVVDDYIKNACAVLSNVALKVGELTLAEFNELMSTPPNYNPFKDFVAGEYDYKDALMRIVVNAPATLSQPVLTDVIPYVDIEDTDDKGSVTITQTTAATKVHFNKFYYLAPEVSVTLVGGSTLSGIIVPNIVSTTLSDEYGRYFEVELLDSTNTRVTGTLSWASKGY